jgi:hypothetical protein
MYKNSGTSHAWLACLTLKSCLKIKPPMETGRLFLHRLSKQYIEYFPKLLQIFYKSSMRILLTKIGMEV